MRSTVLLLLYTRTSNEVLQDKEQPLPDRQTAILAKVPTRLLVLNRNKRVLHGRTMEKRRNQNMKKTEDIYIKKSVPLRDSSGWKRCSVLYSNGVRCYVATKNGISFYFDTKPLLDWFCRMFYGTCTLKFLENIHTNYPRYSYEVVVLHRRAPVIITQNDSQESCCSVVH